MPPPTKSHVVKVTGVFDEMLRFIDERVKSQYFGGRSEYLRGLIRRDLLKDGGPKISEEELDELIETARNEVFAAKQTDASSH